VDHSSIVEIPVLRVAETVAASEEDALAVEEPLEVQLGQDDEWSSVSVTMRTPGNDDELATGFLFTEGIVRARDEIAEIEPWGPFTGAAHVRNVIRVRLSSEVHPDVARLRRNFYTTSSCGICGKASLDALRTVAGREIRRDGPLVAAETMHTLPERLRAGQTVFASTGGLHAAGLFQANGELVAVREDVGRHNAVDKLIGYALLQGVETAGCMLVVSGRASFELVQKAVMAGIPVLAAVGAPSSLAVQLAAEFGMTLAGFVRNRRFNIYSGEWRIRLDETSNQGQLDKAAADAV
jgi:FdhD protein